MPDIVDLPGNLRISDRSDPQLIAMTRSGGLSISGFEQIVSPLSQRWVWRATIPIRNKGQARSLRVVLAQLQGKYGYLRTRICDQYRVSRREMGATPITDPDGIPHSDEAPFSDDYGYALAGGTTNLVSPANAGTSTLVLDTDIPLSVGIFVSINSWLYVITKIDDPADLDNPGAQRTVHIAPPLRDPVTTEDEVNFDAECLWRLASDDTGSLDLRVGRFGTVTLDLVEPVGRTE